LVDENHVEELTKVNDGDTLYQYHFTLSERCWGKFWRYSKWNL